MDVITNAECLRLLGKIAHLRSQSTLDTLATQARIVFWREEVRSYAAELATELLRLNPTVPPLP